MPGDLCLPRARRPLGPRALLPRGNPLDTPQNGPRPPPLAFPLAARHLKPVLLAPPSRPTPGHALGLADLAEAARASSPTSAPCNCRVTSWSNTAISSALARASATSEPATHPFPQWPLPPPYGALEAHTRFLKRPPQAAPYANLKPARQASPGTMSPAGPPPGLPVPKKQNGAAEEG